MKTARVRSIRTKTDRLGTNDNYTMVLNAGEKGKGKEIGRVGVWGNSPKSEEKAIDIAIEIARCNSYKIVWDPYN